MELKDRERKVDVEKLSETDMANLQLQLGAKIRQICDEAAVKVNAILNIYGASAKIAIEFSELPKGIDLKQKTPKKRGRKPKQDNLT